MDAFEPNYRSEYCKKCGGYIPGEPVEVGKPGEPGHNFVCGKCAANLCPDCGAETWCDSVHNGVGTVEGPKKCSSCGWIEYDVNMQKCPACSGYGHFLSGNFDETCQDCGGSGLI